MLEELAKYQRFLQRYASQVVKHIEEDWGWVSEAAPLTATLVNTVANIGDVKNIDRGNGTPTIIVPGFGVTNGSTAFMRMILKEREHIVIPWVVEHNVGFNQTDIDRTVDQVKQVSDQYGSAVNLVGQSLGGCYIRTLANQMPDHVNSVVTMGSPINGIEKIEPITRQRYDKVIGFVDACFIHHGEFIDTFIDNNPNVPTSSLYSYHDGVVDWSLSQIIETDSSENIVIKGSHFSMGFSLDTIKIIGNRLAQHPENWYKWSQHSQ